LLNPPQGQLILDLICYISNNWCIESSNETTGIEGKNV